MVRNAIWNICLRSMMLHYRREIFSSKVKRMCSSESCRFILWPPFVFNVPLEEVVSEVSSRKCPKRGATWRRMVR
eukprot:scaffold22776_cov131-Cylindrotheca_fusiformis.AAC.1